MNDSTPKEVNHLELYSRRQGFWFNPRCKLVDGYNDVFFLFGFVKWTH